MSMILLIVGFIVGVCTVVIIMLRGDGSIHSDTVTKAMSPDDYRKDGK